MALVVVLWLLLSIGLVAAPFVLPDVSVPSQLMMLGFGLGSLLVGGIITVITRLYEKTAANEALVRTGMGGRRVILDGGALVIPVVHKLVRVPLETMRLDVDRAHAEALITADKLRADVRAEFYIRVLPNEEDIINASRSLGGKSAHIDAISELVFHKLDSALRSAAAVKTLEDLNTKRHDFAAEVQNSVALDLKHNGLTLETVTISKLDQTDQTVLNPNNVFDAQGLRVITQITQKMKVERNELEQDAGQKIATKNVSTRTEVLQQEQIQAQAEANQRTYIANTQVEKEREARNFRITQEQMVAEREAERNRAIEAAQISARTQVIKNEQEREMAEREKQIAIARKEAEKAAAEAQALAANAERERSAQAIVTVKVTAEAEREGERHLIAARKEADQDMYRRKIGVDAEAYKATRAAEAEKSASEAQAAARLILAEAEANAAKKRAEGATAEQMVDVSIKKELVNVERAKVDVERQALENRERFGRAAIEFEVEKLRIQASKDIQIAAAQSMAQFMARANFTLYGDPTTMSRMMDQYMKGVGLANATQGFLTNLPPEGKEILGNVGTKIGEVATAVAEAVGSAAEKR